MMNFITKYILKDFKLKTLSLVLASMLWLAVSYMGVSKMSISVRVSADKLSRDLIVSKMDTDEVLVTLNGPVSMLKDIRARDIGISLDLSNVKEGRYVYDLQKNNVRAPKGIQVEEVKPDYIVIEIDGTIEKTLKTIVKLEKKWIGMYSIKSWTPRYVNVEGSGNALKNIESIETIPVDGNFISVEETIDVPLDAKNLIIRKVKPDIVKVILRRN
ncbi:MAG: CdaR family protein [Proteobacteria bacterium]|nr:CdaR family protein [Pseudomonadota bacterium]